MKVRGRVRIGVRNNSFHIFEQFSELRVGLFSKADQCASDHECARDLGFQEVAILNQVHGNVIHVVEKNPSPPPDGDGLITAASHLALSIRFADCQVFAVYAPRKKVIGILHAGWRGMGTKVITAFYALLKERFAISPEETSVFAAPSLCKECAIFSDPLHELPSHLHPFIDGTTVNLQEAAEAEFDGLGIPHAQRERHPACTRCDLSFWSWRRDRSEKKRNYLVAGIVF